MNAFRVAMAALIASGVVMLGCSHNSHQARKKPSEQEIRQYLDGMVGQSADDLIRELGEPTRTESDDADGRILIWDEYHGGYVYPGGNAVVSDVKVPVPPFRVGDYTKSVMFYVHEDGTVYAWSIQKRAGEAPIASGTLR